MKGMTVLKRCRAAEGDMARIRQRIQRRREAMECITPRMDVTGSRSTAEPDKMDAFVAAITELEADLKARELARSAEVAAACVLLDALPEGESSVLHAYYVKRLKMPAIAKRMGYTEGYIRKLKKEGENLMDALPADIVAACLPAWYIRERPEPPNT